MHRLFDGNIRGVRVSKHMVDLFAGLGGASQWMLDCGWNVLRIDNNPLLSGVKNMVMMDISDVRKNIKRNDWGPKIDLIWASPPCKDFSNHGVGRFLYLFSHF